MYSLIFVCLRELLVFLINLELKELIPAHYLLLVLLLAVVLDA